MTEKNEGLLFACILDGDGGGRAVDWETVESWTPGDKILWVHHDRTDEECRRWLTDHSGIDAIAIEALLAEATRPRSVQFDQGLLVILRGVNLNAGSDPEDMVAIRMWLSPNLIVTTRLRRLQTVADIRERLTIGQGPQDTGSFLADVTRQLTDRMVPVITALEDQIDELEAQVAGGETKGIRTKLGAVRRETIALRRYLSPQRDVMNRLQFEEMTWLGKMHRAHLREAADRTSRIVEELDAARDRAGVTQDEIASRLAEHSNRTMYLLAIVSAMLLPPSLLTGYLGINVGGMPGVGHPWAFAIVGALVATIAVVELVILRKLKWL